jgi:hypothetical protein
VLEPTLTGRAAEDRAWLLHRLGGRLREPVRDGEEWMVEVLRANGKHLWYYGTTLEGVHGRIRKDIEAALAARRPAAS